MPKTTYEFPEEPGERPKKSWKKVIDEFGAGFGHEGELSQQRYKVKLSSEYERLYKEASRENRSPASCALELGLARFPLIVSQLEEIDLNNASGDDIGALMSYFSYRNRTLEEITDNMRWRRI